MHRDDLPIATLRDEDFEAMQGAGRRCDRWGRSMVDPSAHAELVARLVLASGAAPCAGHRAGADGTVRFQPSLLVCAGALLMTLAPLSALAALATEPEAPTTPVASGQAAPRSARTGGSSASRTGPDCRSRT
jgi:hypothetical protein